MSDLSLGIESIEKNPRYKILSANCQTFTILFLEKLCGWGHSVQNKDFLEKQTLESLKKRLSM
jgi:hypothetical protein